MRVKGEDLTYSRMIACTSGICGHSTHKQLEGELLSNEYIVVLIEVEERITAFYVLNSSLAQLLNNISLYFTAIYLAQCTGTIVIA